MFSFLFILKPLFASIALYILLDSCNIVKCMNPYFVLKIHVLFVRIFLTQSETRSSLQRQTLIPLHQISEWCSYILHRDYRNFLSQAFLMDLLLYVVKVPDLFVLLLGIALLIPL